MSGSIHERLGRPAPSADVAASAKVRQDKIIAQLGGRSRFDICRVTWPGRDDIPIGLRALSDAAVADAEIEADSLMGPKPIRTPVANREIEYLRMAVILRRAIVDPEDDAHEPLFASVRDLRECATRDELDVLYVAFDDHARSIAPCPQDMTEAEIAALIETLGKTRAWTLLDRCAASTLRACVRCMVEQRGTSDGSTSSTTTRAGATSPAS